MVETTLQPLYGLAAEFDSPEAVVAAARSIHDAGYRRADAFSPFPIEGLSEALGFTHTGVSLIVGFSGLFGAAGGFFMLWYANVLSYPWNIGGRPPNSWEAFIPITFELAILCAGLSAVIGMLWLNGLPKPYHPMFNLPEFDLASQSRFFVVIESVDSQFDLQLTRQFLEALKPVSVREVPR